MAPALSVSLGKEAPAAGDARCHGNVARSPGGSGSVVSDDFPAAFLSLSAEDEDEGEVDLDAMETPSDSESLPFPLWELEGSPAPAAAPRGPLRP